MYDYLKEEINDIKEFIADNDYCYHDINFDNMEEEVERLQEIFWTEDCITGNGSGSYTFSSYDAEKNLVGNWDLLQEALIEFGYDNDIDILEKGAEWCDVTIRCYLLNQAIWEALEELKEEKEEAEEVK